MEPCFLLVNVCYQRYTTRYNLFLFFVLCLFNILSERYMHCYIMLDCKMCPVRQLLAYMCIKPTTTKHQSDDHHEITNQLLSYQNILLFLNTHTQQ